MCLETLKPIAEIIKGKKCGYKVFRISEEKYLWPQIMQKTEENPYPRNKWIKDEMTGETEGNYGLDRYETGFHVFMKKQDALEWKEHYTDVSHWPGWPSQGEGILSLNRVEFRRPVAAGYLSFSPGFLKPRRYCPVVVVKEMKILKKED